MTGKQLYKLWREANDLECVKWKNVGGFDRDAWNALAQQLTAARLTLK